MACKSSPATVEFMIRKLIVLLTFLMTAYFSQAQFIYNENYKKRLDEEYTTGLFKGTGNAYMMVPADDPSATAAFTIFQYLQGRVPGLMIYNNRLFAPVVRWRMNNTALFLNEMRVDAAQLAMINMDDIGLVKIFRPPFVGAFGNGPGGAIAVYTLRGDEEMEE